MALVHPAAPESSERVGVRIAETAEKMSKTGICFIPLLSVKYPRALSGYHCLERMPFCLQARYNLDHSSAFAYR